MDRSRQLLKPPSGSLAAILPAKAHRWWLAAHDWAEHAALRLRPWFPWLIVGVGIALRCSQYAYDRSLFLDEAFVATNIANRSVAELCRPLEFDQRAPAGFLACVKLATQAWGRSDLVLRLVPLASGILSVILFCVLSHRLLPTAAANFALFLFAVSPPLIFMSSDLKQYSTDALATVAILLAAIGAADAPLTVRRILTLGLVGAAAAWFSFPSVFVLAGVAATFFVLNVPARQWRELAKFSAAGAMWGLGFLSIHLVQLRHFADEPGWKRLWDDAFMPFPPRSFGDLLWLARRFMHIVTNPVGLEFAGIAALACLVGIGALYRRSRYHTGIIVAPVVVVLLASGVRIYPVSGRAIIFVAPLVVLAIAAGIDCFRKVIVQPPVRWAWAFMALCVVFQPAISAKAHLRSHELYRNTTFWDYKFEEMKPLMAHLRERWQPGDRVYLYSQANVAFEYYADQFGFSPTDSVRGIQAGLMSPKWEEIERDLAQFRGRPRTWFVFTHNWTLNGVDERRLYSFFLDRMGRRLDSLELPGGFDGAVYLYDLSTGGGENYGSKAGLAAGPANDDVRR